MAIRTLLHLTSLLILFPVSGVNAASDLVLLAREDTSDFPAISFGNAREPAATRAQECKVFPGDELWPSEREWARLNASIDGSLLRPEPAAAVCYEGAGRDAARCEFLVRNASSTRFWLDDPLTGLTEWTQGGTCAASLTPRGNCTRGGFPEYVVNATSVKHIQAAVNFARNSNIRLVIKNTGHDFGGRSVGAGSISIWVHYLKNMEFLPEYNIGNYSGMAVRIGAGVEGWEVSNLMAAQDITVVTPGCNTVGGNGGWLSSGGHTSLTSKFGLGADQALLLDVVTADGQFVTADPFTNHDLFWALRGGGGSTYGIITSVVMKAHPPTNVTSSSLSLAVSSTPGTGAVADAETFWQGVSAYYRFGAKMLDAGGYGFSYIYPGENDTYRFTTSSQFPGLTSEEVLQLMQPLHDELKSLGINVTSPAALSRLYGSPRGGTGDRPVNTRYRSRLLPRANWEDDSLFSKTMGAVRAAVGAGYDNAFYFHGTLTSPTEEVAGWPGRDSAVNPAWRANGMHSMLMDSQPAELTAQEARGRDAMMQRHMDLLRGVSPGAGSYMNEGDPGEPDWQQAFFGHNYERLLEVKQRWDPWGLFWAPTTVGSEGWAVRPVDGYPNSQNGRLCRVADSQ